MGKLEQQAIKQFLVRYECLSTECSKVSLIFDEKRNHYMAMRFGWQNQRRIHLCLVHIEVTSDAVVIHCNNTEDLVASELVALGIPSERIRLAFLPPEFQKNPAIVGKDTSLETA